MFTSQSAFSAFQRRAALARVRKRPDLATCEHMRIELTIRRVALELLRELQPMVYERYRELAKERLRQANSER